MDINEQAKLLGVQRRMERDGEGLTLYHGTSKRNLERIIKSGGILPREITESKGNWQHNATDSRPNLVYLTDAYAIYYAYAACEDGDTPVVLRVQLDPSKYKLYPDEDFIMHGSGASVDELRSINPCAPEWAHVSYKDSLQWLGTCATPIVHLADITGVAIGSDEWLWWQDPSISPLNYKIMGETYRQQCAGLDYKDIWQKH